MAEFTIEFGRGQLYEPQYQHDYETSSTILCGSDARPRTIKFNDTTGDYVVGLNWDNSLNNDLPVGKIRIEGYQDFTAEANLQTGNVTTLNIPPSVLIDSSTGLELTYPYEIPISELGNIKTKHNGTELVCPQFDLSKYRYSRTRGLSYFLADTSDNWSTAPGVSWLLTQNDT